MAMRNCHRGYTLTFVLFMVVFVFIVAGLSGEIGDFSLTDMFEQRANSYRSCIINDLASSTGNGKNC